MINTLEQLKQDFENYVLTGNTNITEVLMDGSPNFSSNDHKYPLLHLIPDTIKFVDGQYQILFLTRMMDIAYENLDMVKILSDLSIRVGETLAYFNNRAEEVRYYSLIASEFKSFSLGVDDCCGWEGVLSFTLRFDADLNKIQH